MKDRELLGKLSLLAAAFIWGTSFVVLKNTLNSIGTMWVLAIRFTFAAMIMLCLSFRSVRHASARCLRGGIWIGAALAAAYIVQTYGLVYTTPGKNAFLTTVYVILIPLISWPLYKKRPGWYVFVAAILSVTGIGAVRLRRL